MTLQQASLEYCKMPQYSSIFGYCVQTYNEINIVLKASLLGNFRRKCGKHHCTCATCWQCKILRSDNCYFWM